jgi:PAS domain S-box-containing protein
VNVELGGNAGAAHGVDSEGKSLVGHTHDDAAKDELKEMTSSQLTPEKWHQMEQEIVGEQVTKRGHSDIYEKEYIRKDGSIAICMLTTNLIGRDDEPPRGFQNIARDVTEEQRIQENLRYYLRQNYSCSRGGTPTNRS